MNKPQLQKALINAVLPSVGTDAALTRKEERKKQFELSKFRLEAEIASEERKERVEERRLAAKEQKEKERLNLDAKHLEAELKKTEHELQWQHEKFEVDMQLHQRKLELEEKIARENKEIEGKVRLRMTLNDKERSRQHTKTWINFELNTMFLFRFPPRLMRVSNWPQQSNLFRALMIPR